MRGKDRAEERQLTPQEIDARIQRLTAVATNLFKRGSYQPAFESLMKAYLLDPTNPHVVDCEKTLMPALEVMRKGGLFSQESSPGGGADTLQLARLLADRGAILAGATDEHAAGAPVRSAAQRPAADPAKQFQQQRIELLKQKALKAKLEREQQMWRDASRPPRVQGPAHDEPPAATPADVTPPRESQRISGGLFAKIKQGRFFT